MPGLVASSVKCVQVSENVPRKGTSPRGTRAPAALGWWHHPAPRGGDRQGQALWLLPFCTGTGAPEKNVPCVVQTGNVQDPGPGLAAPIPPRASSQGGLSLGNVPCQVILKIEKKANKTMYKRQKK